MALPNSVKSTVTRDNLLGGRYPIMQDSVTIPESQTLARGSVLGLIALAAGTAEAGGSNTGDGAISAFALSATGGPATVGDYTATCVTAVTNSGVFNVTDPGGNLIGQMTIAVSSNTTFTGGGITFNIADGGTDFAVGDLFTIPVDAGSGAAALLDATAADGSAAFHAILAEAVTTGSGETQSAPVYIAGDFLTQGLTLGGSTTAADVKAAARDKNCYLVTSYAIENLVVD